MIATIKRVEDREQVKRDLQAMADGIRAAWADAPFHEVQQREIIEAPDRPGL